MLMRCAVLAAAVSLAPAAALMVSAAEEVTTDMSQGGITFKSGDNSLTIGARVQFRFTGDDREDFDADTSGSGVGEEDGYSPAFNVQRMRVSLKGGMFRPWLKYEFQFDFGETGGNKDNKIKDAVLEVVPREIFAVKMGQFKAPFGLQELTSSGRQEFVDRSITNGKFAPARDQGFVFTGVTEKKAFGYAVGAFNGGGEARPQDDQGLMYVGRVWWDPFGEYKLAESATDLPSRNVLHVGFGTRTGEAIRGTGTTGVFEEPDNETSHNIELAYRFKRLFATAEYFTMTDERQNPTQAGDLESSGYHAQAGYMITNALEAALRYAQIDPDDDVARNKVTESRLAVGYFWKGHGLKLQGDVGTVTFEEAFVAACGVATPPLECRGMPAVGTAGIVNPQRLSGVKEYTDLQYRVQMQLAF